MTASAHGLDNPNVVDWRDRAACRDRDPDVMFPPDGSRALIAQAKAVCADCPVTADCLADGEELGDYGGVRAGMTGEERRRAVRPRQTSCRDCGATAWQLPDGRLAQHRVPGKGRGRPYCQPATDPTGV